jgi:hypothetical protein
MTDTNDVAGSASLRRAADRATSAPFFMAYVLAQWGEAEGLTWIQAAARLGCTDEAAHRLALCRRPNPSPKRFSDDVQRIAAYANIDPDDLARIVREADAVQSLRQTRPVSNAKAAAAGLLIAALDRLEQEAFSDPSEKDCS